MPRRSDDAGRLETSRSRWTLRERPDERLCAQIRLLEEKLAGLDVERRACCAACRSGGTPARGLADQEKASERARAYLGMAREALGATPVRNEEAWAAFHAARREEIRLLPGEDLELLAVSLEKEAEEKLTSSWRKEAVRAYFKTDATADEAGRKEPGRWLRKAPERSSRRNCAVQLVRVQQHLDEEAENNNRKRRLQQAQFINYVVLLVFVLVCLLVLQFRDQGLLLLSQDAGTDQAVATNQGVRTDAWWVLSAVLYGTLGGAFSAAQRVASTGPKGRYPEHRWQRVATAFRATAGGAAALVAFAALGAGLLGEGAQGPQVAFLSFLAGFSERFIPSLAKQHGG